MSDQTNRRPGRPAPDRDPTVRGFFASLARGLIRDVVFVLVVFLLATGACALACLYYELPLVLSLIGGLFVLGIALACKSDSIFD